MDALRKENNPDKYEAHLRHIMAEFVLRDAPSQINLGHFERLDTEKKASAVLDALSKVPIFIVSRILLYFDGIGVVGVFKQSAF